MSPGSSTVQGRLLVVTETVDMATALQQQRQAPCGVEEGGLIMGVNILGQQTIVFYTVTNFGLLK